MSIRNVVCEWLEWGLEPGQLEFLSPADKRQFCADVMDAEPEWFFDSVAEFFTRNPGARSKLVACFREGDFLQVGSVMDEAFISYITVKCAEFWESEFTQVQEQESDYQGDE